LIELMIVVAIIGILAAVSLPAYQEFTIRARVSEGLAMLSSAKTTIAESIATNNGVTADSCAAVAVFSAAAPGSHVTSLVCNAGALIVRMDESAQNVELTLTPLVMGSGSGTVAAWTCSAPAAQHRFVPPECRN
jgi:type IV pilus assembly protein PilA